MIYVLVAILFDLDSHKTSKTYERVLSTKTICDQEATLYKSQLDNVVIKNGHVYAIDYTCEVRMRKEVK